MTTPNNGGAAKGAAAGGVVLSASEREEFLAALDKPMTDDEAVGLIAELVALISALANAATVEQRNVLAQKLIRVGNMAPYVAHRLAAVAELIAAAQPFRRDPNVLGRSEHFTTGLAVTLGQIRRLDAALSNIEGASHA